MASPESTESGGDGHDGGLHAPSHWAAAAAAAEAAETADADADANDSGLDSASTTTSSASISSSILEYRIIHGRTYHADRGGAQYWASNDDQANETLDLIHHASTLSLGDKLHLAPLDRPRTRRVLDLGTGTGIWAVDFADEFPAAEVTGTDISPIQPSWVPPNLKFEMEDFTQAWTFREDEFDYVHMRYLYGSVTDWAGLFRQAYRACAPGGWVESYEGSPTLLSDDGTLEEGSAMAEWGKFFYEGARKLGRVFSPLPDHLQERYMEEAGFVDVQVSTMKVPVGDWAKNPRLKEIGRFIQLSVETDLEGIVQFMAGLLEGWSPEDIMLYGAQLRREFRAKKTHAYYLQRVVWAQKPETASKS
ncbi:S-adenosyl-L-methionine-dependent methyltransferase [Sodiomyces alkalinus F11]|uniref:S-adenosyl-L-methionine-dependent methyltransferase n=1 Tax=Sodiomyces alkalinus (strain CBS 110278 / VKM F-3762 / F11) TaxID=1314773 RepID=A0A3N2PPQ7_SODAK|nr:S-adenosyl-L-methionine-dependent methyltransferase [Sodiomyces alkalinus F11]ROT36420.1 S-adenosyl-L-methionine-dependent methyltransferase [Sodiomyces alkalinus F11]